MRCFSVGNSGKPYRIGLCRKENPINQPSISDGDINKALCRAHTVWWGPSFLPFFSALLPEVSASSSIYHLKVSSTLCPKMVTSTCGDHVLPYSHRTEKESCSCLRISRKRPSIHSDLTDFGHMPTSETITVMNGISELGSFLCPIPEDGSTSREPQWSSNDQWIWRRRPTNVYYNGNS